MYRRVRSALAGSALLQSWDPFEGSKTRSLESARGAVLGLATWVVGSAVRGRGAGAAGRAAADACAPGVA